MYVYLKILSKKRLCSYSLEGVRRRAAQERLKPSSVSAIFVLYILSCSFCWSKKKSGTAFSGLTDTIFGSFCVRNAIKWPDVDYGMWSGFIPDEESSSLQSISMSSSLGTSQTRTEHSEDGVDSFLQRLAKRPRTTRNQESPRYFKWILWDHSRTEHSRVQVLKVMEAQFEQDMS